MKYIYVAGPYTRGDPVVNTRNAILAGEEIIKLGYVPFVPHLSHLWHMVSPHDIGYWYNYDFEWLRKCDAILRLPGESSGSDKEVIVAKLMGLPVYYSVQEIPELLD